MKLDLPTPDEIRKIVREELAPLIARFDEAGIKARADLVIPGKERARRYLGFTREMWREAEELGFIQRLPFTYRGNTFLYDAEALVEGGKRYLRFIRGRNGGEAPEEKAAAGEEAPARKE